jgi:hypothetical protein
MRNVEKAGLTTGNLQTTFNNMLNAIGDSCSNHASSNNRKCGQNEDDHDEDTLLGKLCKYDEPCWVMVTISNMIQD